MFLQSAFQHLFPSVKPKRRYVGDVTSNLPVQSSVSPVAITSQEEVQLDLQVKVIFI